MAAVAMAYIVGQTHRRAGHKSSPIGTPGLAEQHLGLVHPKD